MNVCERLLTTRFENEHWGLVMDFKVYDPWD